LYAPQWGLEQSPSRKLFLGIYSSQVYVISRTFQYIFEADCGKVKEPKYNWDLLSSVACLFFMHEIVVVR